MPVEENIYIDDASDTIAQISPKKMLRLQRETEEAYFSVQ